MSDFDAKLRPKFKQHLPKKIAVSRRIPLRNKYECQVSLWVPDTPVSKYAPGIGMTIRHGRGEDKDFLRLVFNGMGDLREFMGKLNTFVLENMDSVGKAFEDALSEWEGMRRKRVEAVEERRNPFSQAVLNEKFVN